MAIENGNATPTLGDQLGLGSQWTPSPVSWRWQELQGPDGKVHVLVETVAGVFAAAFTSADLQRLARQAMERATGLVLPGDLTPGG